MVITLNNKTAIKGVQCYACIGIAESEQFIKITEIQKKEYLVKYIHDLCYNDR